MLDTLGRDGRGRIDAGPATAFQPDFSPGMGIGVANQQVLAARIPEAALVSGHDTGRNTGRAHQDRKRRSIVFTVPGSQVEQELVGTNGDPAVRFSRL